MPKNLTKRQKEILNYIINYTKEHDYAPSFREIGAEFGLSSPATVHKHIEALRQKGFLKSDFNSPRSMELTSKVWKLSKSIELPLLGLIQAGQPIEAIENNETIAVPLDLVRDQNSYVLQVAGNSMIEDGILAGDYVVVERNYYPDNGDVVVALLDNAYATLKRYYREKTRIRLQPANSSMQPIFAVNPSIQGIVRAVIRKFA
jgi:repressor LexA